MQSVNLSLCEVYFEPSRITSMRSHLALNYLMQLARICFPNVQTLISIKCLQAKADPATVTETADVTTADLLFIPEYTCITVTRKYCECMEKLDQESIRSSDLNNRAFAIDLQDATLAAPSVCIKSEPSPDGKPAKHDDSPLNNAFLFISIVPNMICSERNPQL